MKLSIYDMDKTITRSPSWTSWLFFYVRREVPWRLLLAPLMLLPSLAYLLGLLDRPELKQATQALMMGRRVPRAKVERAAMAFATAFGSRMELPAALQAIAEDRRQGCRIWVATASCRYYSAALAARWGVDAVIATENVWDGDFLSNRIRGENCYGVAKLSMILEQLDARPEHVKFVSDHSSDLPALLWADTAVAANPSQDLREVAKGAGWPIRDWT